jgi:hypothetical protein
VYSPVIIQWYIDRAQAAFKAGRWHVEDRRKNNQTLFNLNLTLKDVFDVLMNLKVSNYIEGPSLDQDRPETPDFWKFKIKVYEEIIYVKMKIEPIGDNNEKVKVVSFHIDNM